MKSFFYSLALAIVAGAATPALTAAPNPHHPAVVTHKKKPLHKTVLQKTTRKTPLKKNFRKTTSKSRSTRSQPPGNRAKLAPKRAVAPVTASPQVVPDIPPGANASGAPLVAPVK